MGVGKGQQAKNLLFGRWTNQNKHASLGGEGDAQRTEKGFDQEGRGRIGIKSASRRGVIATSGCSEDTSQSSSRIVFPNMLPIIRKVLDKCEHCKIPKRLPTRISQQPL